MEFNTASIKLAGNPDNTGWSQILEFTPRDEALRKSKGTIFVLICKAEAEISPKSQIEIIASGREVLSMLQKTYYQSEAASLAGLREAVEAVCRSKPELDVAAASIIGESLYVVTTQSLEGYLYRGGSLARLTLPGHKVTAISGKVQQGDFFLLATKDFMAGQSLGVIKAALSNSDAATASDLLAPGELSGSTAAIAVRLSGSIAVEKLDSAPPTNKPQIEMPIAQISSDGGISPKKAFVDIIDSLLAVIYFLQKPFGGSKGERITSPTRELGAYRKRNMAPFVGVILVCLLAVSIFFGVRQKQTGRQKEEYRSRLAQVEHDLAEAQALGDISIGRSRELVLGAQTKAESMVADGYDGEELQDLRRKIEISLGDLAGLYRVEPEQFMDLTLLTSGFSGDEIALSDGRMIVLDTNSDRLVEIYVASKKTQALAGPDEIAEAGKVTVYAGDSYVTVNENIFLVTSGDAKLVMGRQWQGEPLIAGFSGNVYVLDKQESMIMRFPRLEPTLGGGSDWISEEVNIDLSSAKSMAIDGYIWVLTDSGIQKFSRGNPVSFALSGLYRSLESPVDIFLDEDTEFLYVLDPNNSRIVVANKEGNFRAEYESPALGNAKKLVVSEEERKMIFLTGEKLYSIEIKHL